MQKFAAGSLAFARIEMQSFSFSVHPRQALAASLGTGPKGPATPREGERYIARRSKAKSQFKDWLLPVVEFLTAIIELIRVLLR